MNITLNEVLEKSTFREDTTDIGTRLITYIEFPKYSTLFAPVFNSSIKVEILPAPENKIELLAQEIFNPLLYKGISANMLVIINSFFKLRQDIIVKLEQLIWDFHSTIFKDAEEIPLEVKNKIKMKQSGLHHVTWKDTFDNKADLISKTKALKLFIDGSWDKLKNRFFAVEFVAYNTNKDRFFVLFRNELPITCSSAPYFSNIEEFDVQI